MARRRLLRLHVGAWRRATRLYRDAHEKYRQKCTVAAR
jgi:hypothetical protein